MKKIIIFLVIAQLLIISAYGLIFFRGHKADYIAFNNTSNILLEFYTTDAFYNFLSVAESEGLTVSRVVYTDVSSIVVYSSNITLDDRVSLRSGRWPEEGTDEFASNFDSGEYNQVGVINQLIPGFRVSIGHLDNTRNVIRSGAYNINTVDSVKLESFLNQLTDTSVEVRFIGITGTEELLYRIIFYLTPMGVLSFLMVTIVLAFCILASLVQYAIVRMKAISLLVLHGYGWLKIVKVTTYNIVKPVCGAILGGYILFFTFSTITGLFSFLPQLSFYFAIASLILLVSYVILVNIYVQMYLRKAEFTNLIKGKRPYWVMQACNHALKLGFMICIFAIIFMYTGAMQELRARIDRYAGWESARDIHFTTVSSLISGTPASEQSVTERMVAFYADASRYFNGFIMDASMIEGWDIWGDPYGDHGVIPPIGHSIIISPNFLHINPIYTIHGTPVYDEIVWNPFVMNVIVPELFKAYEERIYQINLNDFYMRKVSLGTWLNQRLGLPAVPITIDDLQVNIIYVKDGQYYFTFNTHIRPETGNMVKDPIVSVYTRNIDPSYLLSAVSRAYFFRSDAFSPYNAILPLITEHGLEDVITRTPSAYNRNAEVLRNLQEQSIRITSILVITIIANLVVTYNLVANYFEKNKYKIVIKKLLGFSVIRRNKVFLISLLTYSAVISVAAGLVVMTWLFIVGVGFMLADMLFIVILENRLQKQSVSKVIKGEH